MVWNSISPDGTKSVKDNTIPMQTNTNYIETTMNADHFWNIGLNEDGHHQFAQMQKITTGAPPVPADPVLAAGMDLVYYCRQKTAAESVAQQDVQPFAKNVFPTSPVMQLLGIRVCGVFNVAAGVATIVYKHNLTSVVVDGTGLFTANFPVLPSNNYLFLGGVANLGSPNNVSSMSILSNASLAAVKSTTFVKFGTFRVDGTGVQAPNQAWFVIFGG